MRGALCCALLVAAALAAARAAWALRESRLFGMIAIQSGTHVNLTFRFEHSTTHKPIMLPKFAFSIFDLDNNGQQPPEPPRTLSPTLASPLAVHAQTPSSPHLHPHPNPHPHTPIQARKR